MYDWSSRVCGSMIWYSSSTPIVRDGGFIVGSTRKVYVTCRDWGHRDWGLGREAITAEENSSVRMASRPSPQSPVPSPESPLPWLHQKGWHRRPAARRHIEQRRGREPGEVPFHVLTVAHERRRVEHAIHDLHGAVHQA